MDLEIKGVSSSHRIQAQTKLAKGWRSHSQASHGPRPDVVPHLDLGKLGDSDDEDHYAPLSKEYPRVGPPDSSSTISWGSPMQTPYAQHYANPQMSSLDEKTIPENLPAPPNKFKLKYQQYEADMKEGYKQYTQRAVKNKTSTHSQPSEGQMAQEEPEDICEDFTAIDQKALLQQCYTSKGCSMQNSARKLEADELAAERRKQAVVEQVMVDQLSRAVISDPEQDNAGNCQNQNAFTRLGTAPLRFRNRSLHDTKIKPTAAITENVLSNKLRFDGRIISRNGRDACKELIGFFFAYDKSLTIYEYRQFGKNRTSALPFIQKGIYNHQCGRRKGKLYALGDIYVGANLTFSTVDHVGLSESLKKKRLVTIRIISVDEEAMDYLKKTFVGNHHGLTQQEVEDRNILLSIQEVVKERLSKRGVRTITGLGKHFRQLDKKETGFLSREEYKNALKHFHLEIPEKVFDTLWLMLEDNCDNKVEYGDFTRALIGEMNEYRKTFVRKAYMKLDPNKSGTVTMIDINKFYCSKMHPQVLSGTATEEEIRCALLETLQDACSNPNEVSYCEFEDYYEGLSIGIMNDEDFVNVLRNSWGI
ncbi:calcyphosin-2 isoform X2 [Ambystoma mexicanum]|uniref:calcyphosin-2 isoform X2 n=1 Tax=Ambystoma mexicanum TaxID=8296 RepID=UPI0037E8B458